MKNEMMKKFEELKKANGYFELDGKNYILLTQAVYQGNGNTEWYEAFAISLEDEEDEDGDRPCYNVRWEILEDYDRETSEEYACNWDVPEYVERACEYNMEHDRMY